MGLRYLGNIIRPGYNPLASNITTGVNTAQHQGVFTLQQQAQAQSTQTWTTEPLFDYNTLLFQADNVTNGLQNGTFIDSSNNNFSITRNGNSAQNTFTPFSAQPGAWSAYYSGVADNNGTYFASNAAYSFGTGDFTVEAWINIPPFSNTNGKIIVDSRPNATNGAYWLFGITSTGRLDGTTMTTGGTTLVSPNPVPVNQWVHVAYTRASGTLNLWINGVSVASATGNTNNISSDTLWIGRNAFSSPAPDTWFIGHMSNLRIVKGVAVYTGTFTPPTAPLGKTQSAGTNIAAITGSQTSLLFHQSNRFVDNSDINATPLTLNSWPSIQSFSPIAPQYRWTPSVTGGAGYFAGSGNNLQTNGANLAVGAGDFTFECWVYLLSASGDPGIMQLGPSPFGTNTPGYSGSIGILQATGSGRWAFILAGSYSVGSISSQLNTWTHLAVCRSGTTHRLFVNGVQAGSATDSTNYNSQYLCVGAAYGTNFPCNAYIAGVRLVRGQALATGAFTPPTAPVTTTSVGWTGANAAASLTGTVDLLLNFANAGISDGSMKNNMEVFGNTQVSTSITRYGSGSIFFDGSGDYITIPNAGYVIGPMMPTTNLTIEGWIYHTQRPAFNESGLIGDMHPTAGTNYWSFGPNAAGYLNWYAYQSATQTATSTQIPLNTWTHIAVSIHSGRIRLFVNGVLQAFTGDAALTITSGSIGYITMGQWNNSSNYAYFGYVDDFRITRAARYITSFTPPRVALPRQ